MYNFRVNEHNFRLLDLKLPIFKAPKVSNLSEVKSERYLCLHNFIFNVMLWFIILQLVFLDLQA